MSDSFDPYYKWLGIPPAEQPPHHYRLLGITFLEEDRDVIQTAVDRQMMLLKSLRTGKNARLAERILNEISAAKLCLLDKKKKAAYDAELKASAEVEQQPTEASGDQAADELAATAPPAAPAEVAADATPTPRAAVPPRPGQAADEDGPPDHENPFAQPVVVPPMASGIPVGPKTTSSVALKHKKRRRKATPVWQHPAAIGTVAVCLMLAVVVIYAATRSEPPANPTGEEFTEDETDDSAADVAQRPRRKRDADDFQRPRPARPRPASQTDVPAGGLPAAGEYLGKNGSSTSDVSDFPQPMPVDEPSSPDPNVSTAQVSATAPLTYLDDAGQIDFSVHPSATLGKRGATGFAPDLPQRCRFGGAEVEHAVCMHPPSKGSALVRYGLGGKFREFAATAGLLERADSLNSFADSSVVFKVYGDDQLLWESSPLKKHGDAEDCKIAVADVQQLKLEAECSGSANFAWAAWVNARLLRSDDPEKPDTPAPAVKPPQEVAVRLPVPDDSSQKRARAQITRFYKDPVSQAQSPEQKLELANNILERLGQSSDISERFMLYKLAGNLAAKAGDAQLAMDTVGKMSEVFDIDELEESVNLLGTTLPNVTDRDSLAHLAQRSALLADEAIRRDEYDHADRLLAIAQQAARSGQEIEFLRQLITRSKDAQAISSLFNRATRALDTLEDDPQDAAANQVAGEFLCFVKDEWQRGLPMLAQGTDRRLRDLAAADIASAGAEPDALQLGNGWWEVAQKERGPERKGLDLRAAHWYRRALPTVSDEAREQLEARLQEIEVRYPEPKDLADLPKDEPAGDDKPAVPKNTHPFLKYALKPHPADAVAFGGHYYKIFRGRSTWNDAQRRCAEMGGYLVCLGSDKEARFIRKLIDESPRPNAGNRVLDFAEKDRLWIGAAKRPNGSWRWITGEQSKYANWAPSQPDNGLGNEDRLQITDDGTWHDSPFDASSNEGFVCEWEM